LVRTVGGAETTCTAVAPYRLEIRTRVRTAAIAIRDVFIEASCVNDP